MTAGDALLSARAVAKAYAVPVLVDVDLDLRGGEVHALMGANGAGKSTLTRLLCGLERPDGGEIRLAGAPFAPHGRRAAAQAGVQLVPQELEMVETLSVAEQLFLGSLPSRFGVIDRSRLRAEAAAALARVGLADLDPLTPVATLGVAQRQLVAIAAALAHECRVLILDEPTATLTSHETDRLFEHVVRLRAHGIAVLYISHRMDEIRRIADRVTVLRDGQVVASRAAREMDTATIMALMTAANASDAPAPSRRAATADDDAPALAVASLCAGPVKDVSFEVRAGEILGLAGLVGAGRTETLRAIVGADRRESGRIFRGGTPIDIREPADAVRHGIGFVPEDRQGQALWLPLSVSTNVTLATARRLVGGLLGWLTPAREHAAASPAIARLDVRCRTLSQPVRELSGGNQQKVVIARWLLRDCAVLLLDEPTRGIDVLAKQAIHRLITDLAAAGTAVIVVSSENEELMALCDRIVVLSAGRVAGSFERGEWDASRLLTAAFAGHAERAS